MMNTDQFAREGFYHMLALDHGGSFRKMLNPAQPDAVSAVEIKQTKKEIIAAVAGDLTGVLLDSDEGLAAYNELVSEGGAMPGVMLRMTKQSYSEEDGERLTELYYDAKELKEARSGAVKLLLYFNPYAYNAEQQIETARLAMRNAHENGLPFLLEPVIYELPQSEGKDRGKMLLETITMLTDNGVYPDVWKVEFPGDALLCEQLDHLVGDVPWILLTRGTKFDQFAAMLETACEHGCQGFLAGRALWQELGELTGEGRERFLKKTFPERLKKLNAIAS
jgi:sulfofructosephosphate aldolase